MTSQAVLPSFTCHLIYTELGSHNCLREKELEAHVERCDIAASSLGLDGAGDQIVCW